MASLRDGVLGTKEPTHTSGQGREAGRVRAEQRSRAVGPGRVTWQKDVARVRAESEPPAAPRGVAGGGAHTRPRCRHLPGCLLSCPPLFSLGGLL